MSPSSCVAGSLLLAQLADLLPAWAFVALIGLTLMLAISPAAVTTIALFRKRRNSGRCVWIVVAYYSLLAAALAGMTLTHSTGFLPAAIGITLGGPLATWIMVATSRTEFEKPESSPTCNVCNYNLTANQSGTCPECGTKLAGAESIQSRARK